MGAEVIPGGGSSFSFAFELLKLDLAPRSLGSLELSLAPWLIFLVPLPPEDACKSQTQDGLLFQMASPGSQASVVMGTACGSPAASSGP
jgi:hypothetical protein